MAAHERRSSNKGQYNFSTLDSADRLVLAIKMSLGAIDCFDSILDAFTLAIQEGGDKCTVKQLMAFRAKMSIAETRFRETHKLPKLGNGWA